MSLHTLTISMFGLEKHLWDDVPRSEKRMYISALLYFVIFMILAVSSGISLFFFITSSIYMAIPLGIVLALVIGTIFRFSLVILRKSIFDPEKVKKEKKDAIDETKKAVIVDNVGLTSNQASAQQNTSSKIEKTNQKLKELLSKIIKTKFPKSDTPIPALTGIIRFTIISVIGLLVLFPLACIIHFQKNEGLNQTIRESCVNQFTKDAQESLEMKTAFLKVRIKNTQNEINQQKGLLKEKTAQLIILNQQLTEIINKHNQELEINLIAYRADIENRYFIVQSFRSVTKYPFFLLTALSIILVLVAPHLILHRLKTDKKYVYAEISTKYYKQKIEEKYHENQKYILRFLEENFQYTPQSGFETMVWENPPYCTKKTEHFKPRNELSKDELLKSLIKPSI